MELRTAADNTASQQVAQKIGCISEGVLRGACIARTRTEDGSWTDLRTDFIVWGLLPEDIEGVGRAARRHRRFHLVLRLELTPGRPRTRARTPGSHQVRSRGSARLPDGRTPT